MTHRRGLLRSLLILLSILTIMTLTGCGAVQHKVTFKDSYSLRAQTKIDIGQVRNECGETFDVDVEQMLKDALANQLGKEAMLWDGSGSTKLVLNSKIIEYAKGNAFKRWLLPGWGTTVLTIQCDLKDGDEVVGSAEARRTVSFGGGYTIGAWQTIFESVAKDVVKDLNSQLPK